MEHFYILRNNQESGPFTVKELKSLGLYRTDLVWQDGESTSWKHPDDFEELKAFAKAAAPRLRPAKQTLATSAADENLQSNNSDPQTYRRYDAGLQWQPEDEILVLPSFEALQQKHAAKPNRKKVWKRPVNIAANLFGLIVLLVGVSLAAFMIKKAVDTIDFEPYEETATAQTIETDHLRQPNVSHTAFAPAIQQVPADTTRVAAMQTIEPSVSKQTQVNQQNEVAPKPQKIASTVTVDTSSSLAGLADNETDLSITQARDDAEKKENEEKAIKEAVASLQLSANEYNVGMFGGVSNLELTVSNPSAKPVDRAIIEVDYLKPNGKVVQTQTVEVVSITAGGSKKISIPNSSRGVNVRYRVVNL